MSRIFDALQRSGAEQSGVEYPDMVSVATEVFEAPRRPASQAVADQAVADAVRSFHEMANQDFAVQDVAVQEPPVEAPTVQAPSVQQSARAEAPAQEASTQLPVEFPALEVAVTPASRLVYFTEPDSLAAEKFRFLGVRLRQLQQTRPLKKVLVTSTIPEEGKSLVSANLAGVLARRKQRVLLIEGDMRRPTWRNNLAWEDSPVLRSGCRAASRRPRTSTASEAPACGSCPLEIHRRILWN